MALSPQEASDGYDKHAKQLIEELEAEIDDALLREKFGREIVIIRSKLSEITADGRIELMRRYSKAGWKDVSINGQSIVLRK